MMLRVVAEKVWSCRLCNYTSSTALGMKEHLEKSHQLKNITVYYDAVYEAME